MPASSTEAVEKRTMLFVAESKDYYMPGWRYLTGVRPSQDRALVIARLGEYKAKRGKGYRRMYLEYRVASYIQSGPAHAV